ncbi:MAG: TlpA disulfide reductase family protein [Chitinophagales bacterium]
MKKILVTLFVLTTAFVGCTKDSGSSHDGYLIKGNVANFMPKAKVFLGEVANNQFSVIDTAVVAEDGSFEMKGKVSEKGMGMLRFGPGQNQLMMVLDNQTIEVNADYKNLGEATFKGSPENSQLQQLIRDIRSRKVNEQYLANFIDTVKSPILARIAVGSLNIETHKPSFDKVKERLGKEMPNSRAYKEFTTYLQSLESVLNTAVGQAAPDIELPSPDGANINLSSLKGKVVLVDFWASWCRPCRRENPNVVRIYEKYKDKGFEVYSVSLDRAKDKWVEAIKQDNLIWPGHVSDLGGWKSSAAALYSVKSIPQTFLLDAEGKIIAKNLRGDRLEKKLEELFGA